MNLSTVSQKGNLIPTTCNKILCILFLSQNEHDNIDVFKLLKRSMQNKCYRKLRFVAQKSDDNHTKYRQQSVTQAPM